MSRNTDALPGVPVFMVQIDDITAAASPTDLAELKNPVGSGKVLLVIFFNLTLAQTASALVRFQAIKRSVADTGGTATTAVPVACDSRDAAATPVGVVSAFTANPSAGATGTGYGEYSSSKISVPATTSAPTGVNISGLNALQPWNPTKPMAVLPGESIVVASDGAAHAGLIFSVNAVWGERQL